MTFGTFLILLSFVCLQPQDVAGGLGILDNLGNTIKEHIVEPIQGALTPQNKQSTINIPPSTTTTHLPPSVEGDVSPILHSGSVKPETEIETVTLPGTGDDEIVTGTTEGKNIIGAPSINDACPSGMKNYNGRCRRVIGGR